MDKIHSSISSFEIKDGKRLLAKMLLFVPLFLFVAFININVDPASLYKKEKSTQTSNEYRIAQLLIAGNNVQLFQAVDERLLQKYFIENQTLVPDIVVLGSSRSMLIGNNIFPDKRIMNNSVTGATLADDLGLFFNYDKKAIYPKRLIFLLDPWLLHAGARKEEKWISIKEDAYVMLGKFGIHSRNIKAPLISWRVLNIFSLNYFQKALKVLFESRGHPVYTATHQDSVDGKLLLKDGRFLWEKNFRSRNPEEARRVAAQKLNDSEFIRAFKFDPDEELKSVLEGFILHLKNRHVQISLLLLPFHPIVYKQLAEPSKQVGLVDIVALENYYRNLAKRFGLEIKGSYDPEVCGFGDRDFYDGYHVREEALKQIFKQDMSKQA